MSIKLVCGCGKVIKLKDDSAGKRFKCPSCESILNIPTQNQSAPTKSSAEPAYSIASAAVPEHSPTVSRTKASRKKNAKLKLGSQFVLGIAAAIIALKFVAVLNCLFIFPTIEKWPVAIPLPALTLGDLNVLHEIDITAGTFKDWSCFMTPLLIYSGLAYAFCRGHEWARFAIVVGLIVGALWGAMLAIGGLGTGYFIIKVPFIIRKFGLGYAWCTRFYPLIEAMANVTIAVILSRSSTIRDYVAREEAKRRDTGIG
jgi:hypothetical protein